MNDQMLAFLRDHIGEAHFDAIDAFDVARTIDDYIAEILRLVTSDFLACAERSEAKPPG